MRQKRLLLYENRLNKSGYRLVAGVDEAGRGPLAGPVVAGAVILKSFVFKARIDDSKKLTEKMRDLAYSEIIDKGIVGIGIVDQKKIDHINIRNATKLAMEEAVRNLSVCPDIVIVDGNMKFKCDCDVKCIVRGDSKSMSIAAASILAKVTRDRIMKKYHDEYPDYGFCTNKGYATKFHVDALMQYGPTPLHRSTFYPVSEFS